MRRQVDPFWTPPFVVGWIIEMKVQDRLRMLLAAEPSKGPGRPTTTSRLAELINEMKDRGCSWSGITTKLIELFPSEKFDKEKVRGIWRRHFGKKNKK